MARLIAVSRYGIRWRVRCHYLLGALRDRGVSFYLLLLRGVGDRFETHRMWKGLGMSVIFLSHSSQDIELAERIAQDLRRHGIAVWFDQWEVLPGDSIRQRIEDGLESADFIGVLLTRDSVRSVWVQREWESRLAEPSPSRPIIPLKADDCELPPLLRGIRYADFSDDYAAGLSELLKTIRRGNAQQVTADRAPSNDDALSLLHGSLDVHPYIESLTSSLKSRAPFCIEQSGVDVVSQDYIANIGQELLRSAQESANVTLVIGGIGCGKTTQMRNLALELLRICRSDANVPIPLYISLDEYPGARQQSLPAFVSSQLQLYFPNFRQTWETLLPELASGRMVLLLDGLDEVRGMTSQAQLEWQLIDIFEALADLPRCIASSRAAIGRSLDTIHRLFERLAHGTHFEGRLRTIALREFQRREINAYITLSDRKHVIDEAFVDRHFRLCQRPLFLKLLCQLRSRSSLDTPATNREELLEWAVDCLMRYKGRLFTSAGAALAPDQWRRLMEHCALEMYRERAVFVDSDRFTQIIAAFDELQIGPQRLASISLDARVRTLFDLNEHGFAFGHPLFRDYLAACVIAARLTRFDANDSKLDGLCISPELLQFVQSLAFSRLRKPDIRTALLKKADRPKNPPPVHWVQWRWIPPGLGLVGRHETTDDTNSVLKWFERGFWMCRFPFTVADALKAKKGGSKLLDLLPAASLQGKKSSTPITSVSHELATRIAEDVFSGRLPTECEFERAAGWLDGQDIDTSTIVSARSDCLQPPDVGGAQSNALGVNDLSGNIYQWTATPGPTGRTFVCKGSWWGSRSGRKRNPWNRLIPSHPFHPHTGFRVVVDAE